MSTRCVHAGRLARLCQQGNHAIIGVCVAEVKNASGEYAGLCLVDDQVVARCSASAAS